MINSDGSFSAPIYVFDGSASPLDEEAGNADGSSRAAADTGILRARANVNGPGPATRTLDQVANAAFTDSFIISSASSGSVHVTLPFLVDGTIPAGHVDPFGGGTAGFTVAVQVEAATGSQPASTTQNFFKDNLPDGSASNPCFDTGVGTDYCIYLNNYTYTSANSFNGTVNMGIDIAANTTFYMNTQLAAVGEFWLPLGLPASSDFFSTMVLGGFVLPAGDTVTSGLAGPLTERDGVFNYPSVWAYLDSRTAVPEPASLSLLSVGLIGLTIGRRRRAAGHT